MSELRRRERDRVAALKRRRDQLARRLADPVFQGDPDRQRLELGSVTWVLRLVDACASEGLLSELRARGHDV